MNIDKTAFDSGIKSYMHKKAILGDIGPAIHAGFSSIPATLHNAASGAARGVMNLASPGSADTLDQFNHTAKGFMTQYTTTNPDGSVKINGPAAQQDLLTPEQKQGLQGASAAGKTLGQASSGVNNIIEQGKGIWGQGKDYLQNMGHDIANGQWSGGAGSVLDLIKQHPYFTGGAGLAGGLGVMGLYKLIHGMFGGGNRPVVNNNYYTGAPQAFSREVQASFDIEDPIVKKALANPEFKEYITSLIE